MVLLRSESKATHRRASGLRAGSAIARSFRGSRARCSRPSSVRLSGRGPRVRVGNGSALSARAVPGRLAPVIFPAHAGARPLRVVGVALARQRRLRGGKATAAGVVSRHNYVFSRTAGGFAVLNQSLLAAAG
jgi:hypothetical protein